MLHTGERAVAGVTTGLIGPGEQVTWEARHFLISQRLESRITDFRRPHGFTDEQVRGAFAWFRHQHRFVDVGDGRTRMTDAFEYAAPLGPLGWLAERLFLSAYMRRLLTRRQRALRDALESDAWRRYLEPGSGSPQAPGEG